MALGGLIWEAWGGSRRILDEADAYRSAGIPILSAAYDRSRRCQADGSYSCGHGRKERGRGNRSGVMSGGCSGPCKDAAVWQYLSEIFVFIRLYQGCVSEQKARAILSA